MIVDRSDCESLLRKRIVDVNGGQLLRLPQDLSPAVQRFKALTHLIALAGHSHLIPSEHDCGTGDRTQLSQVLIAKSKEFAGLV